MEQSLLEIYAGQVLINAVRDIRDIPSGSNIEQYCFNIAERMVKEANKRKAEEDEKFRKEMAEYNEKLDKKTK